LLFNGEQTENTDISWQVTKQVIFPVQMQDKMGVGLTIIKPLR